MCNERGKGEGDATGEGVWGMRGGGQGVLGVIPGTLTRPEDSGELWASAATLCGRVRAVAVTVEGACAVWGPRPCPSGGI
jgi:hypothetical protein